MLFIFFLRAGMKGEEGCMRASWQRTWEIGSESFVLIDYLSRQDRPICLIGIARARKSFSEDLQCL